MTFVEGSITDPDLLVEIRWAGVGAGAIGGLIRCSGWRRRTILRAGSGREERRVSTVRARAGGVGGGESYSDADKGRQHIHNPHLWQTNHVARVFPISVAS